MKLVSKTFAEIDVCPGCHGTWLDPGEAVATFGAGAEMSFLTQEGAARRATATNMPCPAGHAPVMLEIWVVGEGAEAIEIDVCPTCRGFFLDDGEGAALDALRDRGEDVVTASGARFSAPPATKPKVDNQARAIDEVTAERGHGVMSTMAMDSGRGGLSLFDSFARSLFSTRRHRMGLFRKRT